MAKRAPAYAPVDGRPRIWLRPMIDGIAWRISYHGAERSSRTVGDAVNDALTQVGMVPAVIMWNEQEIDDAR